MDFDFDFDLDLYNKIDICGLVKKMKSKERKIISFSDEKKQIQHLIDDPPKDRECFKLLSVGGGFSILGIIKYIASIEHITDLYCMTFRIGKKHFLEILDLYENGKIDKCYFITSQTQEKTDAVMEYNGVKYSYYDFIVSKCKELGWKIKSVDNHAKVYLIKTDRNYYIIETSSNLNENPKMEQFNWENDKELFNWYLELIKELLK